VNRAFFLSMRSGTRRRADAPAAQYFEGVRPQVWQFQVGLRVHHDSPQLWLATVAADYEIELEDGNK
jgi:hypothetical protein